MTNRIIIPSSDRAGRSLVALGVVAMNYQSMQQLAMDGRERQAEFCAQNKDRAAARTGSEKENRPAPLEA